MNLALRPALLGTSRSLTTTPFRSFATPTNRYPPNDPHNQNPVDDIDLVFDYPSEGQGSYQKQRLEQSGLDLHSAMPHHPRGKPAAAAAADAMRAAGQSVPGGAAKLGKDVGAAESNNVLYVSFSLFAADG